MSANVKTNNNSRKALTKPLTDVWIEVPNDELITLRLFFGIRGMKNSFLKEFKLDELDEAKMRRHIDQGLKNNSFRIELLKNIRQFVEDHKDEVSDIIKNETNDEPAGN